MHMADEKDFLDEQPADEGAAEYGHEAHDSAEQPAEYVEEPAESAAPAPEQPEQSAKHWYIIHTYSGFENKVQESLRTRADAFGFGIRLGRS